MFMSLVIPLSASFTITMRQLRGAPGNMSVTKLTPFFYSTFTSNCTGANDIAEKNYKVSENNHI
jgi:hypothetical protein